LCLIGEGSSVEPRLGDDWVVLFAGTPRGVAENVYPIAQNEYFVSRQGSLLAADSLSLLPGLESVQNVEDLMAFARRHANGDGR